MPALPRSEIDDNIHIIVSDQSCNFDPRTNNAICLLILFLCAYIERKLKNVSVRILSRVVTTKDDEFVPGSAAAGAITILK